MANVARIEIQVDDANAGAAVEKLNRKVQQLDPAFRRVSESAYRSGEQIGMHYQKALASVEILRSSLGVRLPRALERVIARSQLAGAALRAAFGVTAISFAIPAIGSVVSTLGDLEEAYTHAKANSEAFRKEQQNVNSALQEQAEKLIQLAIAQGKIPADSGSRAAVRQAEDALNQAQATYEKHVKTLAALKNDMAQLFQQGLPADAMAGQLGVLNQQISAEEKAINGVGGYLEKLGEAKRALNLADLALKIFHADHDKATGKSAQEQVARLSDQWTRLKQTAGQTDVFLNDTIQRLAVMPWQQSDVLGGFIDANKQAAAAADTALAKQMQDTMDKLSQQSAAGTAQQSSNALDKFTYSVNSMRSRIQSFFQEITSGNIGQAFLRLFEGMIAKMVATWIVGMEGMQAATRAGYGVGGGTATASGGLTGILGSLFGGGKTSGGATGTSALALNALTGGAALSSSAWTDLTGLPAPGSLGGGSVADMVLPLSAGQGASAAGTVLPAGAMLGTAKGSLLEKLGGIGGIGMLSALSGFGLLGSQNRALNVLGGFLTGGGLGLAIGAGASALGASLGIFGAFLGPIGAILGGLFGWLFGGGAKKKRERERLRTELQQKLKEVEDNYDFYQTDYSTARDQMEQLRQQYTQAEGQYGGSEREWVDPYVDKAINDINSTEAERLRRANLTFGPAQFHSGGFVSGSLAAVGPLPLDWMRFHGGGEVPAVLKPGEFVMRPEAVSSIGRGNLEQMNAGGSFEALQVHMHFPSVYDARGFEQTLRNNTGAVVRVLRQISREGIRG